MYTKREHEDWLNEIEAPQDELRSNGGRMPDSSKYGSWMRKNDPIAFNASFYERSRETERSEIKERLQAGIEVGIRRIAGHFPRSVPGMER